MKSIRFIKLRTHCRDPADLALMRNLNPLRRSVPVKPSRQTTPDFLNAYKIPVDVSIASDEPYVNLKPRQKETRVANLNLFFI